MKFKILAFTIAIAFNCLSQTDKSKEWITIFDGKNIDALRGYKSERFPAGIWKVENGALVTTPSKLNIDLLTRQRFKNFELEYEWAVDKAANSGVFFHVQETQAMESGSGNSPNWLENFEIQVLDDINFYDTASVRSAGSLYDLIRPINKKLKSIGEFNQAKLIVNDGHVQHWLNGVKVLDVETESTMMKELLATSKFKNNPTYATDKEGHIMFQHHGQRVYYKNIRVREL
jgi:hypothetical protein